MFHLEQSGTRSGNRTRVQILADILKVAENGKRKTHVMYRSNLNHRQLEKYMKFLEENGLIRQVADEETGNRLYQVTEKGFEFLREYSRISRYFPEKTM
jgi:predicted transcriptional regulator